VCIIVFSDFVITDFILIMFFLLLHYTNIFVTVVFIKMKHSRINIYTQRNFIILQFCYSGVC